MFSPPSSRTMKYEFLPAVGTALSLPAAGPLFHPLWVRSFPPWLLLLPAVGPLFSLLVSWIILC